MNARQNFRRQQHWQLAERQRFLGELESLAERLRADAARLSGSIAGAGPSAIRPQVHGVLLRPLVERRDKLERSIVEIDAQIAEAREAVAAAQQEIKVLGGPLAQRGADPGERRPARRIARPR